MFTFVVTSYGSRSGAPAGDRPEKRSRNSQTKRPREFQGELPDFRIRAFYNDPLVVRVESFLERFPRYREFRNRSPNPRPRKQITPRRVLLALLAMAIVGAFVACWAQGCFPYSWLEPTRIIQDHGRQSLQECSAPLFECLPLPSSQEAPLVSWLKGCDVLSWVLVALTAGLFALLVLRRRHLFTFNLYLVHPEAPHPDNVVPSENLRDLYIQIRLVHPRLAPLLQTPGDQDYEFLSREDGRPPIGPASTMVKQCNRLLRYAFTSRLQSEDVLVAPPKRFPEKKEDSDPAKDVQQDEATARELEIGFQPAVRISDDVRSSLRALLSYYVHTTQLRGFLFLVLVALAGDLFIGLSETVDTMLILAGLVWLTLSIRLYRYQLRRIYRWVDQSDEMAFDLPTFEFNPTERQWQYVNPGRLRRTYEGELGAGFNNGLAIAVTVMFALFLALLSVL